MPPKAAKRKRTAKDGASAPKKSKMSSPAPSDFLDQYYQGVDWEEFDGIGLGTYLFGTHNLNLTFHSPMDEPMWFEIMSGLNFKGPAIGCIRLCAYGKGPEDSFAPRLLLPLPHIGQFYPAFALTWLGAQSRMTVLSVRWNIWLTKPRIEQFIIIDEPRLGNSNASGEQAYRAIIIPTAAVGASPLKRTYPQIIQFNLPDQKAGKDFEGKFGEENDDPNETYRSLITRVINEQLAPYQKTVIDASSANAGSEDASPIMISYDVALKHEGGKDAQKDAKIKGQLLFLKTGILFHSPTTVLYLTAKSTPAAMLIHNFEGSNRKEPTNLSLVCPSSEPYYEGNQETKKDNSGRDAAPEPVFITFNGIDRDMSTSIAEHAKSHGMKLRELEQSWYSLEKEQPMTGWMPRGFGI